MHTGRIPAQTFSLRCIAETGKQLSPLCTVCINMSVLCYFLTDLPPYKLHCFFNNNIEPVKNREVYTSKGE